MQVHKHASKQTNQPTNKQTESKTCKKMQKDIPLEMGCSGSKLWENGSLVNASGCSAGDSCTEEVILGVAKPRLKVSELSKQIQRMEEILDVDVRYVKSIQSIHEKNLF